MGGAQLNLLWRTKKTNEALSRPLNFVEAGALEGHQQAIPYLMILKTLTIHLETFKH